MSIARIARTSRLIAAGLLLSLLLACTSAPPTPTQAPAPAQPSGAAQPAAPAQPPSKASAPATKLPVKFGWQLAVDFPFLAARESGIFEEAGLAPEFIQFNSGREMLPALQSKSIDVATASGVIVLVGLAQDLDIKVVYVKADETRAEALMVPPKSGIQKVGDLVGKRVAYAKGSSVHYALFKALAASGVSPDKLTLLDVGPDKAFAAFIKDEIDAWWVWQPWFAKARAEGGKAIVTDGQAGVTMPAPWFARTEWLTQNPEAAKRLGQAARIVADRLKQDRSLGVKPLAKAMAIPEEMASEIFDTQGIPTAQELLDEKNLLSMTSPAGLAKVMGEMGDFLYEQKALPKRTDPSKAIDPAPLRAALQERR